MNKYITLTLSFLLASCISNMSIVASSSDEYNYLLPESHNESKDIIKGLMITKQ